ncbi:GDP-mannose mannosyl hydrolase [Shewanella youngdeokensis]|uniref:GDP-mannose mannosyl hydrolase n=1 Tax=Shewanella youngdeokensis TaxID=2999068 RepID=A0ABZ0K181_9GAMM|nr:GDP-mannose mannosyl hydrolase [Shewanella sp. DAU334]
MFLDKDIFTQVIDSTPLVSIDLVIENSAGEVLLGLRNNKPAQGFWFVPGGRILKNESMDSAFQRLCQQELGVAASRAEAEFLGPYEHFYTDSVFSDSVSTHYVVLGYKLRLNIELDSLPSSQHNQYCWMTKADILNSNVVHKHSQWYIES